MQPGWFDRQAQKAEQDIKNWPKWMKENSTNKDNSFDGKEAPLQQQKKAK